MILEEKDRDDIYENTSNFMGSEYENLYAGSQVEQFQDGSVRFYNP